MLMLVSSCCAVKAAVKERERINKTNTTAGLGRDVTQSILPCFISYALFFAVLARLLIPVTPSDPRDILRRQQLQHGALAPVPGMQ